MYCAMHYQEALEYGQDLHEEGVIDSDTLTHLKVLHPDWQAFHRWD
jgi:hypothetical protein